MEIIYILIILLSVGGLSLCCKINFKKKSKKPLVCAFNGNCDGVIKSDFSSFFGIGLEIFGGVYYGLLIISYSLLLAFPQLFNDFSFFILTGITMAAFFFSLYLTFVQAFFIKSWCTWCLFSAGLSTLILILSIISLIGNDVQIIPILASLKQPIILLHLFGFALGVGGATVSDILFFKFLKDFKISPEENKILKVMSQIIWFGLLIVVISGLGLYLPNMEILNETPKFLMKMIAVIVIIINGSLLNLLVSPKLMKMYVDYHDPEKSTVLNIIKAMKLRKTAFALGAVSFVSWYTAFILGSFDKISLGFWTLFLIYFVALIVGVVGSLIFEKIYSSKRS